jgi:hypothetical protein
LVSLNKMKLKIQSVAVPEDLLTRIKHKARQQERSLSGHVRFLMERDLKEEKENANARSRKGNLQSAGESHS